MDYELKLGHSRQGKPLVWKDASNGHIALLGQSGRGKSYALKKLLLQLTEQNVRVYIFDCSGDFSGDDVRSKFGLQALPLDVRNVRQQVKMNPFRPLKLSATYTEEAADTAARLTTTILDAYRFRGNAQPVYLRRALTEFMHHPDFYPSFSALVAFIASNEKRAAKMEPSLVRLEDLARLFTGCGEESEWNLEEPGITILQFDTIPDRATQVLVTELLLADLWATKLQTHEGDTCPIVVLLDECQRFSFNEMSMIVKILREGRKYHINGWFASQWLSDKNAVQAIEQAALRAYFYPGDRNVRELARTLCANTMQVRQYEDLIRSLSVGQFVYVDQAGRTLLNCVPR